MYAILRVVLCLFSALTRPTLFLLDRSVQEKDEFGGVKTQIKFVFAYQDFERKPQPSDTLISIQITRPFIIDLESTNGTHVNDKQIPTSRYYELVQSDSMSFYPLCLTCPIIHIIRFTLSSY
jgi:FHA domain